MNFTKFQLIQLIQTIVIYIFFYRLSDLVEILWGLTKFISNRFWKFQLPILKNKKNLFIKDFSFWALVNIKTKKALFTDSIFREGFDSINQGSLQKWTGGTHLHIWHTWLQWNHRILIVWIIFLVKVQWWKLAIKCPTRPYVCSTVCSYVRTSVCCNDILHTYIHNT